MIELILATLAAYRVAWMLAVDDGPFDLFSVWRELIGVEKQETWLQRGFGCPGCISFWTALVAALALGIYVTPQEFLLRWLAIAGGALFLVRKS